MVLEVMLIPRIQASGAFDSDGATTIDMCYMWAWNSSRCCVPGKHNSELLQNPYYIADIVQCGLAGEKGDMHGESGKWRKPVNRDDEVQRGQLPF
jgi:hypothetical protein